MHHKDTKTQRNKLTVPKGSVFFLLRQCVHEMTELERLSKEIKANKAVSVSIPNKRRGNLPSLINSKELSPIFKKITLLRTQRSSRLKIRKHFSTNRYQDLQPRKIATRIQQSQLSSFFNHHIRRLAMTTEIQEARFL